MGWTWRFKTKPRERLPYGLAPWIALAIMLALWPREEKPRPPGRSEDRDLSPAGFAAAEPGHGRLAGSPKRIPWRGWRDILWRSWKEIGDDRLPRVAAGAAFFVLLAVFPAIGAFVALYGLFADVADARDQLIQLARVLPPDVLGLVGDQMVRIAGERESKLSLAFGFALLLSLWSANAGVKALFDGLNIAYDETEKRGFIRLTLVSLAFTLGGLLVAGATVLGLTSLAAGLKANGLDDSGAIGGTIGAVVMLLLSVTWLSVLYRYGPSRAEARWRWVSWGGAAAGVSWMAGSAAFSFYLAHLAHYSATYGSLSAVIGLAVWIWLSLMVVLMGAELNSEIEHQTAVDSTTGAPRPLGERGAVMADTVGKRKPDSH